MNFRSPTNFASAIHGAYAILLIICVRLCCRYRAAFTPTAANTIFLGNFLRSGRRSGSTPGFLAGRGRAMNLRGRFETLRSRGDRGPGLGAVGTGAGRNNGRGTGTEVRSKARCLGLRRLRIGPLQVAHELTRKRLFYQQSLLPPRSRAERQYGFSFH